jgi:hypothetical protein
MTDEVTGGLPTTAEPTIKATQPKAGGLSIGANKGLSSILRSLFLTEPKSCGVASTILMEGLA